MAAAFYMVMFFGMWGLYATFVSIACSQLEKLRANLLDIRQNPNRSEQDSGADTGREEEEKEVQPPQELFRCMQRQLNDCVRHHQQILRYVIIIRQWQFRLLKQNCSQVILISQLL
jgi:hypothetical protein